MNVIVFNCIDLLGEYYKFAYICATKDTETIIQDTLALSTEVLDYEIIPAIMK